jgi:hypothetical protein
VLGRRDLRIDHTALVQGDVPALEDRLMRVERLGAASCRHPVGTVNITYASRRDRAEPPAFSPQDVWGPSICPQVLAQGGEGATMNHADLVLNHFIASAVGRGHRGAHRRAGSWPAP